MKDLKQLYDVVMLFFGIGILSWVLVELFIPSSKESEETTKWTKSKHGR